MADHKSPPEWIDEIDIWFDVNPQTREITFRKEHPTYKRIRADFAAAGYDIDQCKTATDIVDIQRRHRVLFEELFHARMAALKPRNLEQQYLRACYFKQHDEAERLKQLLIRKRKLNVTRKK